jgi:hypothetical protein
MNKQRDPAERPSAANDDDEHFVTRLRRWRPRMPEPRHFFIILTGAAANVTFVTFGVHGAFGMLILVAFLFAAWLISIQAVLYELCFKNGVLLSFAGLGFYAIAIGFNVLLAAGGLTATFGANSLGQSAFRQSVAVPLAAIARVTDATSQFGGAMAEVAAHSARQQAIEVAQGGTCTASPQGNGPISRLREDDAAAFAAAKGKMDALSARARALSTRIEGQIANYSVAQHQQVIETISVALVEARQLARDPGLARVRGELEARSRQIGAGRPDRQDSALLVSCPRDTLLGPAIGRALAIPMPEIGGQYELPPVPSEATSVRGLFYAAISRILGGEGDLGPWLPSLALAPFPDALFVYGLTLHRRRRKADRTLSDEIAAGLGLAGGDPEGDIGRALQDERVRKLYASHVVQQGWLFRTHWLAIPASETARRRWALRLVEAGKAFDADLCKGDALPTAGDGFAAEADYHLFALKPGIWPRLEAETIRAALADPAGRPDPSAPVGAAAGLGSAKGAVA